MESHGAPGRIHVSEATRAEFKDAYEVEPRGTIEVKGKGAMQTFFVGGPVVRS